MRHAGRLVGAVAVVVAAAGCAAARHDGTGPRPAPRTAGSGLYVYLRESPQLSAPAPPIVQAWAKREDGTLASLEISGPPAGGAAPAPERVWLSGTIAAGAYVGLELALPSRATTSKPEPARPDDETVTVPFPFLVADGTGTVLLAETRGNAPPGARASARSDVFLSKPPRIASGLLGLASVRGWLGVALFDKRTGRVSSVLPVGREPSGIAIDAERLRAYVAVAGEDTIAVLDLLEERVRERVTLRGGDAPVEAALTPDGRMLIVANSGSDSVSFVDTTSAMEVDRLSVGARPVSVVLSPDGRRAYVVSERASSITVINVTSRSIAGSIATETGPVQARLGGRSGEVLFVAHAAAPYLLAVDTSTLTTLRRVYVGNGGRAIEVDPRTGRVFLARAGTGAIEVFDPSSLLPIDTIDVAGDVAYLALEREGNGLGIVLPDAREVAVVGIVGGRVSTRVALGPEPAALRFVGAR